MPKREPQIIRFSRALEALGETKAKQTSSRYVIYTRKNGGFYYLGRQGALRVGATIKNSHPASDLFRAKLLTGTLSAEAERLS